MSLLRGLAALLLAATAGSAMAIPASYDFRGIGDTLLSPDSGFATDPFTVEYEDRQLGVATAVNNNGFLIGFWLTNDDTFKTHSLQFGVNPKGVVRFSENFIGLSGSDVPCFNFLGIQICANPEYPYGARVDVSSGTPTAHSAFLNTPFGSVAVANSLPFMRFPGNFVEENDQGVLASTQLAADGQYGVLIRGTTSVPLLDVPWLVNINNLAEPLVIAYDGNDGGCLVYGETCLPEPTPCESDPNNGNGGNSGREASGHAWGHNKCKDGVVDGNNGGGGTGGDDGTGSGESGNGALLIRLFSDNTTARYRFPTAVAVDTAVVNARNLFPLAINNTRVVLRGDLTVGSTVYDKRLLSCTINEESLDADADGVVDCQGGLLLIGGLTHSIRVGTVIGFTLNNEDLLVGNLGHNAAGIGLPAVIDLSPVVPVAELLGNLAADTDGWEIHTITDMNARGMMTGYGYKDCGSRPEAFFLAPRTESPGAAVRFQRGAFEHPAYLAPGTALPIRPTLTGGSGNYEVRVHIKTPDEESWELFSDWASDAGTWRPGNYIGEVCFRIEARDPAAPEAANQQMIVRYSVGVSAPPERIGGGDTGTGLLTPTQGEFEVGQLLTGGLGFSTLCLLGFVVLRRRPKRAH